MIEFAHGFFNLEHPAANTSLPAGRHTLRGWLVEKPGEVLTDLRVRCAGRTRPAAYGFIRPDLAAHFKHPDPHLPAAFEVPVFLQPGTAILEFEALSIDGRWLPVHQARIEVAGPPAAPFVPDPEAPVNPAEFSDLLRQLLRLRAMEPDAAPANLAARLVSSLACPRYLLHPPAPFHGFFREPAIFTRAAYGRLLVDGYLFHETAAIVRVLATFDLHVWQTIPHGGPSPIAPRLFPQHANAARSNVKGYADVPSQLPRPLTLRLYAELADGSRRLCVVQQTSTFGLEDEKKPFPPASPVFFLRTARALHTQLTSTGIGVAGGAPFRRELWRTWRRFSLRAPRHRAKVPSPAVAHPAATPPSGPLARIFDGATAPSPWLARQPQRGRCGSRKQGVVRYHSEGEISGLGKVMVFTQNLDCEGAPLLLLEYCRHLIARGGAELTLISARDGSLRKGFQDAGAAVRIVDATPLARAESAAAWRRALRRLGGEIDCRAARLVVANTLASYWAVHLAHRAGTPSLLYIHESTTPAAFYHGTASPAIIPFAEESFRLATRVSFNTASTARYYEPFAGPANYHLNPGWIDLAAIDAHRAKNSREQLRAALGVADEHKLVINLGAVCERKGQNVFAWAVDLLWRRNPGLAAQCDFRMVGGRNTPFDASMAELVAGLGRPNLHIVPETSRAYDFLGAADLFVCSSHEESFPRVVLEAMAMEVPILSTDVHGIPEMAGHEKEALLVPPGDSSALADGLARMLSDPESARALAGRARVRVAAHFDTAIMLPRQVELAHQTIAIHGARG